MVNGNNIFISLDSSATTTPFAATRTNEIQSECKTIEISSPTIGDWRHFITGRKEWSFTVGWLIGAASNVTQLLNVGTSYTITICGRSGSTSTALLQGSAILKTCKVTATRGNLAQGSFSFVGNGALEEVIEQGGGGGLE